MRAALSREIFTIRKKGGEGGGVLLSRPCQHQERNHEFSLPFFFMVLKCYQSNYKPNENILFHIFLFIYKVLKNIYCGKQSSNKWVTSVTTRWKQGISIFIGFLSLQFSMHYWFSNFNWQKKKKASLYNMPVGFLTLFESHSLPTKWKIIIIIFLNFL